MVKGRIKRKNITEKIRVTKKRKRKRKIRGSRGKDQEEELVNGREKKTWRKRKYVGLNRVRGRKQEDQEERGTRGRGPRGKLVNGRGKKT